MDCIRSAENVAKSNNSYSHLEKALSLSFTSHNTGSSYTAWANFYLHLCALHITAGVALYSFYQDVGVIK